jgi:hypothetical protein
MIASSRILAIAAISAVVLAALPSSTDSWIMGLIESNAPDLLELVPEVCREDDNSEFQEAVTCAFDKLLECGGIIQVLPDFLDMPSLDNITECIDIQEPFCAIASTCTPCIEEFDTLIRCMVLNEHMLGENATDLLDSCALDVC